MLLLTSVSVETQLVLRHVLVLQRKETDARERDPTHISDAYAECYPAYHGFAGAVVDSDDEDLSHMDSKGEKGKGRTDFQTEEQWQVSTAWHHCPL